MILFKKSMNFISWGPFEQTSHEVHFEKLVSRENLALTSWRIARIKKESYSNSEATCASSLRRPYALQRRPTPRPLAPSKRPRRRQCGRGCFQTAAFRQRLFFEKRPPDAPMSVLYSSSAHLFGDIIRRRPSETTAAK